MKDQDLVKALRTHVEAARKIGLYRGKSGIWAVIEQAADRIANQDTHILALQKEIEGLRAQLDLRRCALCDYWLGEEDPRCMHGKSPWGGKTVQKDNYCSHWEHHTDWIPVTQRLPENGVKVLCWYEYFRYGDFNAMFATYGIGYQFHGTWGGEVANGRNAKVLAWMPLPEPPEVKNAKTE